MAIFKQMITKILRNRRFLVTGEDQDGIGNVQISYDA